ncbi:hypothetical protein B1B_06063, partial [mine drainage metagenome]
KEPRATLLIPGARVRYLAEIAEQGRGIHARIEREAEAASKAQSCHEALREIGDPRLPRALELYAAADLAAGQRAVTPDAVAVPDSSAAPQNDKGKAAHSAHAAHSARVAQSPQAVIPSSVRPPQAVILSAAKDLL